MTKKVTSVNLDEDIAEHFSNDPSKNLSGTVNMLLEEFLAGGGGKDAMLELRKDQLESDISELESRLETKRAELEQVNDQLAERRAKQRGKEAEIIAECSETLSRLPESVDSPAIEYWAGKCDLSEREFYDQLKEEMN